MTSRQARRKTRTDNEAEIGARHASLLEALEEAYGVIELQFDEQGEARDYRFLQVNPAFSRLTGIADPVGHWVRELVPDIEPHWFQTFGEVARTGKTARVQNRVAGLGRWLDVLAYRVDAPKERHVAILFSDVTEAVMAAADRDAARERERNEMAERRRAEASLSKSEARFRSLIELSPVGIATTNPDGTIALANDAFLSMLGYTRDEIRLANWREHTPPEYLVQDLEHIEQLRRGETTVPFEKQYVRRDGTVVDALVIAQFLPGQGERMVAFAVDITARKQAERLLREHEAQLRMLIDHMAGFVGILDTEGTILEVGEPAIKVSGLTRAGVVGKKFWECSMWTEDPVQEEQIKHWIEEALQGKTIRQDVVVRTVDGGRLDIDLMLAPVLDDQGAVTHVIPSGIDVSERKRFERALRENEERLHESAIALQEADRRKDVFLATLAHELRNPLAPLRNAVQILRLMSAGNATFQRTTEMMERQVQHLVRLVDDLLDISRITRGKVDLRREPVVLNDVVSSAIESCGLFSSESHELHVEISPEPLTVMGDADRLRQVFSNLLSNAAKFTPHPGEVWVSLERSGAQARVVVRDNGIGIPRDRLQSVFEMFAQGPDARRKDGLGIGLALVRQLIHLHGGTVTAESEGPGRGSRFTVCLPLAAHAEVGPVDGAANVSSAHPRRILVVDDNVDAAETLQQMLRLQGHDVRMCTSGRDAISQVARDPPDLIFMDIGMPEMDGLTATRRIRELPKGGDIRIVALTGWGQERDRERTRQAGMDGHLVKPVSPVQLASVL